MSGGFREAGGEAPPAPRAITPDAERDSARAGSALRTFGKIWTLLYGAMMVVATVLGLGTKILPIAGGAIAIGGPFCILGAILWLLGERKRRRALGVFENGEEAHAVIKSVELRRTPRINGRRPWEVKYELTLRDGHTAQGDTWFFDDARPAAEVGQRVIALYDPKDPKRNVLWTDLSADGTRQVRVETELKGSRVETSTEEGEAEAEAEQDSSPLKQTR